MTWDEVEPKWGGIETKVHAKWGKLTRAERRMVTERRQQRPVRAEELYDLTENEIHRAISAGHLVVSK